MDGLKYTWNRETQMSPMLISFKYSSKHSLKEIICQGNALHYVEGQKRKWKEALLF